MPYSVNARHVEVYRRPGRFAGWPANYGMWAWGDEIVLVFTCGAMSTGTSGFHAVAADRGFTTVQMRSLDGGIHWAEETFTAESPSPHGLSVDEHLPAQLHVRPQGFRTLPESLDLAEPDVAVLAGRTGTSGSSVSWLYASTDGCRTWLGPFGLPSFGLPGISARTDRVVLGPQQLLLVLTGSKADGGEGCVVAAHSADGGRTFHLRGHVGDEPARYRIMPATVRLTDGTLVTATRCSGPDAPAGWIEVYRSIDDGRSWRCIAPCAARTGRGGNPPTLTLLEDGRLCLIYGYRDAPSGIRARLCDDAGTNWGEEIVLRDDGGSHDLGYPRTVRRADGALVTAYYFTDAPDGERYIAATVWQPGEAFH